MATKAVHQISIEADTQGVKSAIRDLSVEYAKVQKKIIEGNGEITQSELELVATYQGQIKEMKNLERAQNEIARIDKLANKGVKDLTNSVKGLGGATEGAVSPAESLKSQLTDMASKAGLAALAVKGLQEVVSFVRGGFDNLTESIKNSQVLGLTMVQFEGLNILAQSAGASIDDLRNVFGALARAGKDPWQGLMEIADALEGMGLEAERTKYMVEQYGESGTKLIPMLMGGKDALFDAMEAAQEYGLVIGKDAVDAHNALTAEITALQTQTKGLARQLASEATPLMTAFLQNLRDGGDATRVLSAALQTLGYVGSYVFEGLRGALELALTSIKTFIRVVQAAWDGFKGNLQAIVLLVQGDFKGAWEAAKAGPEGMFEVVKEGFSEMGQDVDNVHTRLGKLDDAMWGVAQGSIAAAEGMMSMANASAQLASVVSEEEQLKAVKKAREEAKRAQDRIDQRNRQAAARRRAEREKELKEAQKAGEDAAAAILAAQEEGIKAEEAAGWKRIEAWRKIEIDKLKQKIAIDKEYQKLLDQRAKEQAKLEEERAKEAARKAEAIQQSLNSELMSAASSTGSIIADGLFGPMEEGVNRFEEMGRRLLQMLAELAIKAAAAFAIQAATGQAGGGIGGALASAAGFASGGYVSGPGTSKSDSIPARLSNGEYVINAESVDRYGRAFFDRLNNLMPSSFAGSGSAGSGEIIIVNPPTEQDLENFLSSNRGRKLILNASRGFRG